MMVNSSPSARNRRIESAQSCGKRGSVRRALVLLWGLTLGVACVDLTPPPEVLKYRNSLNSGGAVGTTGGAGEGGGVGAGGAIGGGATGTAGATGVAGMTGAGGSPIQPDAHGVGGSAGGAIPDVALGSGGAAGSGGAVVQDGAAGGATGVGGNKMDASPGAGGSTPDAPVGTGGVLGTGGVGSGGKVGTGGVVGSGGTTAGTGGASGTGGAPGTGGATGYSCASAIVPASGVVTNFSDWNATTSKWGSGTLTGNIYQYAGSGATINTAKVEGTPPGLHLTGTVPSANYGGGGLTFLSCVTVASYTKVQFDVYGSSPNCAIELQLQTFDQRPADQTPPGGCKADGGTSCFNFPLMSKVVDLSTTVTTPKTVSATLASFTNWTAAAAGQIVGMQWQFTLSSGSSCTVNATFTNIKFVP
jgi:hypothetical protein